MSTKTAGEPWNWAYPYFFLDWIRIFHYF